MAGLLFVYLQKLTLKMVPKLSFQANIESFALDHSLNSSEKLTSKMAPEFSFQANIESFAQNHSPNSYISDLLV